MAIHIYKLNGHRVDRRTYEAALREKEESERTLNNLYSAINYFKKNGFPQSLSRYNSFLNDNTTDEIYFYLHGNSMKGYYLDFNRCNLAELLINEYKLTEDYHKKEKFEKRVKIVYALGCFLVILGTIAILYLLSFLIGLMKH